MNNSWQIEQLIKRAFIRTKERFLSYFLVVIVGILIILAAVAIGLILGIPILFLIKPAPIVAGIMAAVLYTAGIVAFFYITSWIGLAGAAVLIEEPKLGVSATYKSVRSRVWGFVWFNFLTGLFIIGLLPLGILSLGVVFILWAIWGSFALFVYLKKQKKGIANLWTSKALVSQKFWGIVWRVIVVYVAVMVLQFALAFGTRDSAVAALGGISSGIISLFTGPFITSFLYEMYTNLTEPTEVKTPKVWVGLSIIGWVLSVILFVALTASAITLIQSKAKDIQKLQMQMQKGKTNSYDYGSKL